jgi:hypothetical protein
MRESRVSLALGSLNDSRLSTEPLGYVSQCLGRHRVEDDDHFLETVLLAAMDPDAFRAGGMQ